MSTNFAKKKADRPERPELDMSPVAALKKAVGERSEEMELSRITIDQALQVRSKGLDAATVERYRAVIQNGGELPAITVYRTDMDNRLVYLLAAGFHRVEAHRLENRTAIQVVIRQGTREDAMIEAARSNLAHGLDLKVPDLRRALEILLLAGYYLKDDALASNAVMAADLGVSTERVSVWTREIVTLRNLRVDLSKRWGKDGRVYEVEDIQKAATLRAEAERERRATEDAERKRNLPAIEKIRIITTYLISKYRDAQAKKKTSLLDDPNKGYKWCYQVSNPTFVMDIDWENQFLREYAAKPVALYREFLRLTDQATFIEAEMDAWTDTQMADWVYAMKQRPPRQPNSTVETFQRGGSMMAQPKNPDLPYQPPAATGRHRLTEVAATETETHSTPTYQCPIRVGQRVKVITTGEITYVAAVEWVDVEWRLRTESYPDDYLLLSDVEIVVPSAPDDSVWAAGNAAEDAAVDEALELSLQAGEAESHDLDYGDEPEINTNPAPCPFKVGDRVVLKRNPKPVNVVKSIKQFNGAWRLTMTTGEGYEFYEVPANLDFAPVESAVVVESQAVIPFRTGDIVKDVHTGEYVEVVGFSSDGSITVKGEDKKQYEAWAEDFQKIQVSEKSLAQASSKPNGEYKPSNGTQTQMTTSYIALMNIVTRFTNAVYELEAFDLNIQYLQQPETLENIWQAIKSAGDFYTKVSEVILERLTIMANTGLPYDAKLAEQTRKEGMQRA